MESPEFPDPQLPRISLWTAGLWLQGFCGVATEVLEQKSVARLWHLTELDEIQGLTLLIKEV